ncbi:hypothetical protein F4823DRAFT_465847 [Ustulina deusta]|nr:hypothetical protein F4823DRAFT_465847 [Ustulina deusta]
MAPHQAKRNIQKFGRQCSVPKGEPRPQGVKKERPQPSPRRSPRLQRRQERTVSKDTNTEPKHPLPSPTSNTPGTEAGERERKRKRSQEPEGPSSLAPSQPLRKQRRTSLADAAAKYTHDQRTTSGINDNKTNSIGYWSEEGRWPKEYFNQDDQTRKDFEKYNEIPWVTEMGLNHLLARKKSTSSLRGKQSEAGSAPSSTTASDEKPREAKSTPYKRASYETVLATKGSFMDKFDEGIEKASSDLCQTLLHSEQTYPQNSLFRDDLFDTTCRKIRNRNESMVVRDISQLIIPSAQTLATYGATNLDHLIESVNEGWNCAEPFYGPRPQPDYSVGFGRSAFTDDQLEKLKPFVGEVPDTFTSYFMATWQMFFPFLTCEVKCGAAALDIADRQNAHSMTLAVRGVVELFRMVKREKELHREILAFSISHDHRTVRIYGHYPVINGEKTTFYRHAIHTFDFTALDGKEKWTAYKFTKNVYSIWMPTLLKRICSVIDALPSNEASRQSEPGESGLSQGLESHNLLDLSSQDASSLQGETDNQSSCAASQDVTPHTSVSPQIQGRASKKPRKRGPPGELRQ